MRVFLLFVIVFGIAVVVGRSDKPPQLAQEEPIKASVATEMRIRWLEAHVLELQQQIDKQSPKD
jgi:hypothetical protein